MGREIKIGEFVRKATTYRDLDRAVGRVSDVKVTEVIELSREDFNDFKENLCDNYYWLEHVDGVVLVKCTGSGESIAVKTEGYSYARYAAKEVK